jgi:hypothetical protein
VSQLGSSHERDPPNHLQNGVFASSLHALILILISNLLILNAAISNLRIIPTRPDFHTYKSLRAPAANPNSIMTTPITSSLTIAVPNSTTSPKPRSTVTQTKIITITLPEDFSSSSLSPHAHVALRSDSFQWPVTHGIVPGSRVPNSLPISAPSFGIENTPTPSQPRTTSTVIARRSTYPRPSPPGFLYPEVIVPRQANMTDSSGDSDVIWYLPYSLEVLIFTVMVLGILWTVLVWLVNFPPRTWRREMWGREEERVERRPLDKPSKYVRELESGSDRSDMGNTPVAKTSATCMHENKHVEVGELGIELKHRHTEYGRSKSSPATTIRSDIPSSPHKAADSPPNPFLHPPNNDYVSPSTSRDLQTRTSSEWLRQHAAFFSASNSSSRTPSLHSSLAIDNHHYDHEYDIEALEAGTALLTPRSLGMKDHRKSLSWVDLGLGKVEGAVSGFVGKVARWTDDEGGREGEGVLLPVVNGRQDVKIE